MTDEEIIKTAANLYGLNHQTDKMLEEMGELAQAFIKFRHDPTDSRRLLLLSELADVSVLLDQMRILYGDFDIWREKKLKRLEERMRNDATDKPVS